ncbi:DUF721 domain-containing protein [Mangrovicoccus algicola]|uniref:DUF721 domain-containing protein n=1 Tax=Mangrovicoccus algicola TaxID=2771008 RepID=A0A8J6Z6K2_9RHOB|nr:DUF721 domain-containing protein [Mangrovicoccus algicola]MBE3638769.1 DUF721 domain-containing protein [Mangrovicoccus algicola]
MADAWQSRTYKSRRGRGFASAGSLVQTRVSKAGESRGFAMTRLLTHWTEVVGEDLARMCEPVKVGFARKGGLGATLTILVRGAAGPIIQAQSEVIRARVNACYGYNAIARIALTQTSGYGGFAEAQAAFRPAPAAPPVPTPEIEAQTQGVTDPGLRDALAGLGARIHARQNKGRPQ